MINNKSITIVGAGPAGLFCAYLLLESGFSVKLFDQSSGAGKKFLVAGNGGLNLTHSEDLGEFSKRYGKDEELFKKLLSEFSPSDLRAWCSDLGVETFIGSSGRVFPKKLKAAEILINWLQKLKSYDNFELNLNHSLVSLSKEKELVFSFEGKEKKIPANYVVLALGGASWEKTGSDGKWKSFLEALGLEVKTFLPMNCGFETTWSSYFVENVDRFPLKNIGIVFKDKSVRGEAMLTPFGIEGGGVYALSNYIRDEILKNGSAEITLDLKPGHSSAEVFKKLKDRNPKTSLPNHLRKVLKIEKEVLILLKELLPNMETETLAKGMKALPIKLIKTRPLAEAISTSGGIAFSGLTENFESKVISNLYFAGEMLDFEAPTGGYLLQGCFSTAHRIVENIKLQYRETC